MDINEDLTINYRSNTSEVSFGENTNGKTDENNVLHDSLPKTIREEKLLAVSRLFNTCYRTVIPNRPPVSSRPLSTFNPQPIGKNFQIHSLKFSFSPQDEKSHVQSIISSANGAIHLDEVLWLDRYILASNLFIIFCPVFD